VYARDRIRGYVKLRGRNANQQVLFSVSSWTEPDWAYSQEYNKADLPRQKEKEKLRLKKLQEKKERDERYEVHRILRGKDKGTGYFIPF